MNEENKDQMEQLKKLLEAQGYPVSGAYLRLRQNHEQLKSQMKQLGFGEVYGGMLLSEMEKGTAEFTFSYRQVIQGDVLEGEMKFARLKTGDYSFKEYTVGRLRSSIGSLLTRKQTIAVGPDGNANNTFILREVYALMMGGWVQKQVQANGQSFEQWARYDPSVITPSGNFGLITMDCAEPGAVEKLVHSYPIVHMETIGKEVTDTLKSGNRVEVYMKTRDGRQKFTLVANPEKNRIDLFLGHRRVDLSMDGEILVPGLKVMEKALEKKISGERAQQEQKKKRKRIIR